MFSLLTGFLEGGETPEAGVAREVHEELGLTAHSVELIGHFPLPRFNQLIIAYALRATGQLALGEEIAEVKAVSAGELAGFEFGPLELTRNVVSLWLQRQVAPAANNALPRTAVGGIVGAWGREVIHEIRQRP